MPPASLRPRPVGTRSGLAISNNESTARHLLRIEKGRRVDCFTEARRWDLPFHLGVNARVETIKKIQQFFGEK